MARARWHAVSWPTVQRAVDARVAERLGEPAPTPVLGIDEVRFGRPRWVRDEQTGRWWRTDPWATRFVDLATGQGLLGQMTGRTSADVRRWLAARAPEFRAAIRVVALDPSAPHTHAVGQALPHAAIALFEVSEDESGCATCSSCLGFGAVGHLEPAVSRR